MTPIIIGVLLLCYSINVAGVAPSVPGTLALEPSYSYLGFDTSLDNSTSTLVFANRSLFVMARKCNDTAHTA